MNVCPKCGTNNLARRRQCESCGYGFRDRVPHVDLLATLGGLFTQPRDALLTTINAERKSFSTALVLLAALRFGWLARVTATNLELGADDPWRGVGVAALAAAAVVFGWAALAPALGKLFDARFQFGEARATHGYALGWFGVAGFGLAVAEFTVFGPLLFTNNPSPFTLKPAVALAYAGVEAVLAAWTIGMLALAGKLLTGRTIVGIAWGVVVFASAFGAALLALFI
jgi:hypothetical protein